MKRRILTVLVLGCLSLAALGQNRSAQQPLSPSQFNAAHDREVVAIVRGVDLKAGITQPQANAIAELYFGKYIAGCGRADPAVDRGSHWEVTPRIGYGGTPDENPIVIEKHTGKVSWRNGPVFASLASFLSKASP